MRRWLRCGPGLMRFSLTPVDAFAWTHLCWLLWSKTLAIESATKMHVGVVGQLTPPTTTVWASPLTEAYLAPELICCRWLHRFRSDGRDQGRPSPERQRPPE